MLTWLERLPVYADSLLKEDLVYELHVREMSIPNLPVYDLLSLYRQQEGFPVREQSVYTFYQADLSPLARKVEQVSELVFALAEGVASEKQIRRCRSNLIQARCRAQDAKDCGKFSEEQLEQLRAWLAVLSSLSVPGEISNPELLGSEQNTQACAVTQTLPIGPCAFAEPVGAQASLPFNSSNNFTKLPHPLAQLLNQVGKYNVLSLDNTLVFLLFRDTIAIQVRTLALDVRPVLALLFSKLVQPLAI